jgi:predicted esterase
MNRFRPLVLFILTAGDPVGAESRFRPGEVYRNQACRAAPDCHFNLYVPSGYKPGVPTPLLLVLSPNGNADVRLFQAGAEQVGWLVCGSVESQNGQQWEFYKEIHDALRKEMVESFTIHPRRTYYSGMSGGSRVAYEFLWRYPETGAGVIGMAAGMHSRNNVPSVPAAACVGIVGRKDFNYWEVLELKYKFPRQQMAFRFIEWDGGHDWATSDLVADAIQWLDYRSYVSSAGLTESEKALRPKVLEKYLEFIGSLKPPLDAYEACEALVREVGPDDPAGQRAAQMVEAARDKLSVELKARKWVEDMILTAIRQGGAAWYGGPALRRARQLASHYPNTVYGRRAAAFAQTLADQLKRNPPPKDRFNSQESQKEE